MPVVKMKESNAKKQVRHRSFNKVKLSCFFTLKSTSLHMCVEVCIYMYVYVYMFVCLNVSTKKNPIVNGFSLRSEMDSLSVRKDVDN